MGGDAMMVVRAELSDRLEALRRFAGRRSGRDFTESVVGIKRLAAAYGFDAVVRLSEAMERDTRRGDCPKALYLDRLHDAIGCHEADERMSEAMIASISVRLG